MLRRLGRSNSSATLEARRNQNNDMNGNASQATTTANTTTHGMTARERIGNFFAGRASSFDEQTIVSESESSKEEIPLDDSLRTQGGAPPPPPSTTTATAIGILPLQQRKVSTQVFVSPAVNVVKTFQNAVNDITALTIFIKNVEITHDVCSSFIQLIRGDNRSWEAIAVDILRQKARWDCITFEGCKNTNVESPTTINYMDVAISFVLTLDHCSHLHLTNMILTEQLSKSFTALAFTKAIRKLQLDLIDLTFCIPLLAEAMEYNTSLTSLIASRCGLKDDVLAVLMESIPPQLEELRLFGNKCRSKALMAMASKLQNTKCHLEILDISYQHVTDEDNESSAPFDISFLAAALISNTTLKKLDLDNDNLDDSHLAHIVAALEQNETLEELSLNHNKISDVGVALMASKFQNMKGLKKISMYSNAFG